LVPLAERLTLLKIVIGCLAALSIILLFVIAVLVWLLLKAKKTTASKVDEEPDDLPTLSGPRPSDHDFKIPEVRSTSSPAMASQGNKSPYMPLNTVDNPNGGASITFQATSF